jgi:hypothetical protein
MELKGLFPIFHIAVENRDNRVNTATKLWSGQTKSRGKVFPFFELFKLVFTQPPSQWV